MLSTNWRFRDSPVWNQSWRVPQTMEDEMDTFLGEFEDFMRQSSTMMTPRLEGATSLLSDTAFPRVSDFFVSKGPELQSPFDLSRSADTGSLLYSSVVPFTANTGMDRTLKLMNENWPEGWGRMQKYNRDFGVNTNLGTLSVINSLEDRVGEVKIATGQSVSNLTMRVPKDKEAEMDAFFEDHEKWMRSTHCSIGTVPAQGQDPNALAITNFWVAKGPELVDPMNEALGDTGNLIYTVHQVYPSEDGVAQHCDLAKKKWKGWEKLKQYSRDYGLLTNVQSNKVILSRW